VLCIHCGDQVCIRHEREGLIHKHGRYTCRNRKPDGNVTVAQVSDVTAEQRLRLAASVKLPAQQPEVQRGRRKPKEEEYDRYL
jgi:hypothetical protein